MEWLRRRVKFRTAAAEFRNSVEMPLPEVTLFRTVTIAIRSAALDSLTFISLSALQVRH